MSSDAPKWRDKMEITYEEFFTPPPSMPHPGLVGLVREMEAELGREEAHRILAQVAERLTVEGIRRAVEAEPIRCFRDFIECRRRRGPISTHGTSEEVIEETDDRLVLNMTECLWARAWREMGAEDIGYLWNCRPDYALVRAMHPRLRLRRSKTLMQGDEHCDFTYYWEADDGSLT
jgi:hypothetical protein